jgi:hypothetical protein
LGVLSHVVGQKFQGDKSVQGYVLGLIDDAHSAADLLDDAVVRDGLADHAQACYGGRVRKSTKAGGLAAFQKRNSSKFEKSGLTSQQGTEVRRILRLFSNSKANPIVGPIP